MVRVVGAEQDGRGAVLGVDEVPWGLGADAGVVGSLRDRVQLGVVFSSLSVRPLWMAGVHAKANLWMVEVGEGQLRGLHAAAQSGHGHHFPPMVTQFGHVLFSFTHREAGLLHLHPQSKAENLVDNKWTLQATFAGAISQQVGLHLVQRGQGSTAGTEIDHAAALHPALPADGDVYGSSVEPILVPTDCLTASHHITNKAFEHLVMFGKPGAFWLWYPLCVVHAGGSEAHSARKPMPRCRAQKAQFGKCLQWVYLFIPI